VPARLSMAYAFEKSEPGLEPKPALAVARLRLGLQLR
jgi:hypothetical protein